MDVEELENDVRTGRIGVERLLELYRTLHQKFDATAKELEAAKRRIEELEGQMPGGPPMEKIEESYSLDAELQRQDERKNKKRRKRKKGHGGRRRNAEKIATAVRIEKVFPEGVDPQRCTHSHTRPVWRIENGQAVRIAYEIYRGPNNKYGRIPGVIGRSEFGLEIVIALAYQVFFVGLSFDKACDILKFFLNLNLSKAQANALLNQLARHWEVVFECLCTLLAHSAIVHTDETSWSINSVWAFLSEKVRLLFFGVHKNSATLERILAPATFEGIVISDDAAVYSNFTHAQKCWAHLLRKAIKLTLLEPANEQYRQFCDRLLAIYRKACRIQRDRRYGEAGRKAKVSELEDELIELCLPIWNRQLPPQEGTFDDLRRLVNELMRLLLAEELFTFVTACDAEMPNGESQPVAGTNNEGERSLRSSAEARKTGRTNKTLVGARCRTIIVSVFESLRVYLPTFSFTDVLDEILSWAERGESCFETMARKLRRAPPFTSPLDEVLPVPDR